MAQIIIYNLNKKFIISNSNNYLGSENNNKFFKQTEILNQFSFFEKNKTLNQFAFNTDNVEKAYEVLKSGFKYIEAAGGVVQNSYDEILMIYRLKRWDLPKGKREENESTEDTAYREISEECGITKHKLINKICDTYHTYELNNIKILKKTYWYYFKINELQKLIPQSIENIEKAEWIRQNKLNEKLGETYPSIIQVIEEFKKCCF